MSVPRIYCVDYPFLSCGSVFTDGLENAANDLGIDYAHASWDAPDLQQRIVAFAPDLLFVVHGRKFAARFQNLKGFGVPTALWSLDDPYEIDEVASWSSRFDYVFVCDSATLHRHQNATYLPTCFDPHVHYADASPRWRRVGFIGGANSTRDRYLSALVQADLLDYVVGGVWGSAAVQARCLSGNIPPAMTAALYRQTKIIVNIWREVHHFNYSKIPASSLSPRVYEALACGAIVASEWRPEVETLVPELPTFRTEGECVGLIGSLLADRELAEEIRHACMKRLQPHTYAARLQTVLETCRVIQAVAV